MHPAEASAEPVRSQLEKILASPEFLRNERLSKFLRFVVEQQLAGKAAELKESLVGIEVFGRTPGFDPTQDSVVRTEAAESPAPRRGPISTKCGACPAALTRTTQLYGLSPPLAHGCGRRGDVLENRYAQLHRRGGSRTFGRGDR